MDVVRLYVTAFQITAVLLIVGGIALLGIVGPAIPAPTSYVAEGVGILITLIGVLMYRKIDDVRYRLYGRRGDARRYAALVLALIMFNAFAPPVMMQYGYGNSDCSTECWTIRTRVISVEYFIIMITAVTFLIALAPIVFHRTVLGQIFQEISGLAASALILLIGSLLLIFPIHVIFVPCGGGGGYGGYGGGANACYIDVCQLLTNGPPLMRIFLKWILPPGTC